MLAVAVPSVLLVEEQVGRIKFTQPRQTSQIKDLNIMAVDRQEVAISEFTQHPVHMNRCYPAGLSQVGLGHREGEMCPITSPDRAQFRFDFAEEVADPGNRVETTKAKYPFAMHGGIEKRAEPQ